MDNTSIITQVANPKEEEILSCQEKGKAIGARLCDWMLDVFVLTAESLRLCC